MFLGGPKSSGVSTRAATTAARSERLRTFAILSIMPERLRIVNN